MKKEDVSLAVLGNAQLPSGSTEELEGHWHRVVRRRSFLKVGAGVGSGMAAVAIPRGALLATDALAGGQHADQG